MSEDVCTFILAAVLADKSSENIIPLQGSFLNLVSSKKKYIEDPFYSFSLINSIS